MSGMSGLRHRLVLLALAGSLAACSGGEAPRATPAFAPLDLVVVASGEDDAGRGWDGVVEAVRQATLTAQTPGRVAEVHRDVDDRIAEGELLARLDDVEQAAGAKRARANLRAAEAALAEAETRHRRHAALAERQYVAEALMDEVRTARDAARAAGDAARAALAEAARQVDYTTIRAPFAGLVATREVEPGESVLVGRALMTVFAPEALRIEVELPQSAAAAIGTRAQVRLDDGRALAAARVTVFPHADTRTHAIRVRVDLPPLEQPPRPGTSARVHFPGVRGTAWPRVPAAALVRRGEVVAVYVVADGRPSLRQIRLGAAHGETVDVIAGLRVGEAVARDPLAALRALAAARAQGD